MYVKMKEMDPVGGVRASGTPPPDPPMITEHWKVVLHVYDTRYGAVMYHVLQLHVK